MKNEYSIATFSAPMKFQIQLISTKPNNLLIYIVSLHFYQTCRYVFNISSLYADIHGSDCCICLEVNHSCIFYYITTIIRKYFLYNLCKCFRKIIFSFIHISADVFEHNIRDRLLTILKA